MTDSMAEVPVPAAARPGPGPGGWSGRRGSLRLLSAAVAGAVVVVAALAALNLGGVIANPFATTTTDRSGPVLIRSITDLSRYEAATGSFQVVVDIERDVKNVPDVIAGQRTLFVATGTVDAYVDLGGLDGSTVVADSEDRAVRITLPAAQLERANLDQENSYVFSTRRGLLDKVDSLFNEPDQQEFYVIGARKIDEAAQRSELRARATANTEEMLTTLMASLGYRAVVERQSQ